MTLFGVILACSLIQSVFGVGLLVFGTPLLLFLGYSFPAALFHLLPCSMLISALQLKDDFGRTRALLRSYLLFLAPAAAVGAVFVFCTGKRFDVRSAVGVMLLASALLRFSDRLRAALSRRLAPNLHAALAAVGLLHGATNMGGGLLTATANALYSEKTDVRANIALGYLLMAALQFVLLLVIQGPQAAWRDLLPLLAIAAGAYLSLGRRFFSLSTPLVYQHSMTAFMVICGLLLLKK